MPPGSLREVSSHSKHKNMQCWDGYTCRERRLRERDRQTEGERQTENIRQIQHTIFVDLWASRFWFWRERKQNTTLKTHRHTQRDTKGIQQTEDNCEWKTFVVVACSRKVSCHFHQKKAHFPLPPQNLKKQTATTDTMIANTSGRSSLLPDLLLIQWLAGDEYRPCARLCDKFKPSKYGGKGWSGSEDCLDKKPRQTDKRFQYWSQEADFLTSSMVSEVCMLHLSGGHVSEHAINKRAKV